MQIATGESSMSNSQAVGLAGEKAVVNQLKSNGWTINNWDTSQPGSTDIDAQSGSNRRLVQVKSAVTPYDPPELSPEEEGNIKSRATKIGAEAWEAKVWLDAGLNPVTIKWRKLN